MVHGMVEVMPYGTGGAGQPRIVRGKDRDQNIGVMSKQHVNTPSADTADIACTGLGVGDTKPILPPIACTGLGVGDACTTGLGVGDTKLLSMVDVI